MHTTFSEFLKDMPCKKRVAFKAQMVADLGCSKHTITHWYNTNIIPQYVRNYLHKMCPVDVVFDYTPFSRK